MGIYNDFGWGTGSSFTPVATASISGVTTAASTDPNNLTVTYTATGHAFVAGDYVTITGITPSVYNVTNAVIITARTNEFDIRLPNKTVLNQAITYGSYVSGGTAEKTGVNQPSGVTSDDILYGQAARLVGSAEPFRAIATDYDRISLTWSSPQGDYTKIRLVRSNDGYPETSEDGLILWEWEASVGGDKITAYEDGPDSSIPLVQGRFAYYRIWIKQTSLKWDVAADAYALVPIKHSTLAPDGTELVSTQNKVLDVLPRVFTSASQSPIDEVDETSDLYRFLKGLSFELDRIMTYTELLLPLESGRLVSPEILLLQSLQLGMPIEPYLATKQQRRLAREALYIYQNKGTVSGTEAFVESLTGFAPDVSNSPNLVLTRADSSFTNGVGFWQALGGCTIKSIDYVAGVGPLVEPYADDYRYVGEVVVSTANARITSGTLNPKLEGTPVKAGTPYIFSGYGRAASGTMDVTGYVTWYDQYGNAIPFDGTSTSPYWPPITFPQIPQELPSSWTSEATITNAVGNGTYATYTTSSAHGFVAGDSLIIVNVTPEGYNGRHLTVYDAPTSTTFRVASTYTQTYVAPAVGAPTPTAIKQTSRFEIVGVAPGGTVDITSVSISSNVLTFTVSPYNPFVFGNTVIVKGTPNSQYDGNYLVQGYTPTTFSVVFAASNLATTATSGTVTQAYPNKGSALTIDSASVTSGVATVVFTSAHGLAPGDYIEIQGLDPIFSFGVHTITAVTTGVTESVSFLLFKGIGVPADNVTYATGPSYGTAREVLTLGGQVTATAYPPAVYAGFDLVFKDTGTVYLDMLQMATFDVPDFHEARAAEIFLYPTNSNFVKNPGFKAAGMSNWIVQAVDSDIVDRTSIGRTEAGSALLIRTSIRDGSSYSVSSNVVTVTLTAAHEYPVGAQVLIGPSLAQIISASVVSDVASVVLTDATGLIVGDNLVIQTTVPEFAAFIGTHTITGVSGTTISFALDVDDATFPIGTVYGVAYKYTNIYGARTITAVTSNTFSFALTTADTGTINIPLKVSPVTVLSTTTSNVPTDKYITASFYAKLNDENSSTSIDEEFNFALTATQLIFSYANNTLTLVGSPSVITTKSSVLLLTEEWQRFSLRIYIPPIEPVYVLPGTLFQVQLNPVVITATLAGTLTNTSVYIDQFQIEPSFSPTDYFDGDLPPEYGAEWEGLKYSSATHLYPNLAAKATRLQQELPNYLPLGTSFLVEVYGSKYYKPLT